MSEPTPTSSTFDKLWNWRKPKPAPEPEPAPPPPAPAPGHIPYLRIWALMRNVNLKEIGPILFSVPVLVFFALSGFVAWFVVFIKFMVSIWRALP